MLTEPWRFSGLRRSVAHFSGHYDLPKPCPARRDRCFELSVVQHARPSHLGSREVELDVEWAHAVAPAARIDVLEDPYPEFLIGSTARKTGAHVFSSSWSWRGLSPDSAASGFRVLAQGCGAAHVVCAWASGDNMQPGSAPADSPAVLAIGGTMFLAASGRLSAELAWPQSGTGTTRLPRPRPSWQGALPCDPYNDACTKREIPDVSATADGVRQYGKRAEGSAPGWSHGGGTSLATPLWAALIALADQELAKQGQTAIGIDELHAVLYDGNLAPGLDNLGTAGWSFGTGWGSPKTGIVDVLTKAIERYRAGR